MDRFRKNWQDACREVINRSAREIQCAYWWAQIENPKVLFQDLGTPGVVFAQYDGKLQVAALAAAPTELRATMERYEEEMWRTGKLMAGRQSMRMILDHFKNGHSEERALQRAPPPGPPLAR